MVLTLDDYHYFGRACVNKLIGVSWLCLVSQPISHKEDSLTTLKNKITHRTLSNIPVNTIMFEGDIGQ